MFSVLILRLEYMFQVKKLNPLKIKQTIQNSKIIYTLNIPLITLRDTCTEKITKMILIMQEWQTSYLL